MRIEQLEAGARVRFGAVDRAATQVHPATAIGEERDRWDRLARAGVVEALLETRLGEIERIGGYQAEHEVVEGADDVALLLFEQPSPGERVLEQADRFGRGVAGSGALARQTREHEPLARRRARQVVALLEAPGGRRPRLEACLPGMGGKLGFEQEPELAVLRLDDVDRALERLDRTVGLPGHGQRVRELARGGRMRRRLR